MPRAPRQVNRGRNGGTPHHNGAANFQSLFTSPPPPQHQQNGLQNNNNIMGKDPGPLWTSLIPGVQYAIAHALAQQGPLSQGLMSLNLKHAETVSLLHLIEDERRKNARLDSVLLYQQHGGPQPSPLVAQDLLPVTESLPAFEVAQGQRFLRARGMDDAADRLAGWVGSGGSYHHIDFDAGLVGFLADLHSREGDGEGGGGGGSEEAFQQRREAARHLLHMDGRELLVRLDPPPETVNPQRVGSGAGPRASPSGGVDTEGLRVLSEGLHPVNYCVMGPSGNRYSVLDESDWPDWEAVRAMGGISNDDLGRFTEAAAVPDAVNYLDIDDLLDLGALDQAEVVGATQGAVGASGQPAKESLNHLLAVNDADAGFQAADVKEAERQQPAQKREAQDETENAGPADQTEGLSDGKPKGNDEMEKAVAELVNAMAGAVPFDEQYLNFSANQPPAPGLMWWDNGLFKPEDQLVWNPWDPAWDPVLAFSGGVLMDDPMIASPPGRKVVTQKQPARQEVVRQQNPAAGEVARWWASGPTAKDQGDRRVRASSAPPAPGTTLASGSLVEAEGVAPEARQPSNEMLIPGISLMPPPEVRQFSPELAAEVHELLGRNRGVRSTNDSRRAVPAQNRRRTVTFVDVDSDDEMDEDNLDEDGMEGLPVREDDSDDDFTVRPSRARARRFISGSRPLGLGGRPRGSGTRRRTSGAECVSAAPTTPTPAATTNLTESGSLDPPKKRGPGRPRKHPLPEPKAQSQPTDTPSSQPAVSRRKKQTTDDAEAVETPKVPRTYRKRKAPDDANVDEYDYRPRKHKRYDYSPSDPNVLLHSTEGRSMTRAEFLEAFKPHERKYHPGGRLGGGQYIIVATGETWTFETFGQKHSHARREAEALKAQQPATGMSTGDTSTSTAQKEASETIQTQQSIQPVETPRAHSSGATIPSTPSQPTAKKIRLTLPSSSSPATPTPTPQRIRITTAPTPTPTVSKSPATPKTDDTKPKGIRDQIRERVQELDERCRRFNVKTRDKFRTHKAFLEYAEGMRDLLFPEQAPRMAAVPATAAPRSIGPAPAEGFAEIRERVEKRKRGEGVVEAKGQDADWIKDLQKAAQVAVEEVTWEQSKCQK
ncbi:hypothetical protein VTJ49DRAFT_6231 [Mycothermus thermophilus]|uniref:Uncharacterized protein n=1 Tax=Humicola insolens TaxID=85995 RepID=A0ABR3VJC3_HUMIN